MARHSALFTNSAVVLQLRDLLDMKPLFGYYKVFVCFSTHDETFAKKISDSLKKRGVDAYFFRDSHDFGDVKYIEEKEIAQRDKILFVASENSIASNECQGELSLGIRKRQERAKDPDKEEVMKNIFIPITIDDRIREAKEPELESRLTNFREGWQNIQVLRQQVIADFSDFRDRPVGDEFEKKVDDIIMRALLKSKPPKAGAAKN